VSCLGKPIIGAQQFGRSGQDVETFVGVDDGNRVHLSEDLPNRLTALRDLVGATGSVVDQ
jgi:hypothetical protein